MSRSAHRSRRARAASPASMKPFGAIRRIALAGRPSRAFSAPRSAPAVTSKRQLSACANGVRRPPGVFSPPLSVKLSARPR